MMRHIAPLFIVFFFSSLPLSAREYESAPSADDSSMSNVGDYRSKTDDWMISPSNSASVSAQLESITTTDDLTEITGDADLKLTDVALLRLLANYSMGGKAQLYIHAALLPKQTTNMDENVFQNAGLALRTGIAEHFAASLYVAGGATSDRDIWGNAGLGIESRWSLSRYVRIDAGVGGSAFTILGEDIAQFASTNVGLQIGIHDPGRAGAWIGANYSIPVWWESSNFHRPTNRLNLEIGAVYSYIDHWDLYVSYSILDRGDVERPETLLPILDGGFDQRKLTFGLAFRFGGET